MSLSVVVDQTVDDDLPPGMRVTVSTDATGVVPVDLVRIHPDGSEHRVLTEGRPYLIGGVWTGVDWHAPRNVDIRWRAATSTEQASAVGTVYTDSAWLVPADDVTRAVQLAEVVNFGARSRESRAGMFQPVADGSNGPRPKPIFVSDDAGRGPVKVAAVVRVADEGPLWRLLEDDGVVLVVTPGPGWRVSWMWAQALSDEWANPARAWWPYDDVTLPLVEAADPLGDVLPTWTDGDLQAFAADNGWDEEDIAGLYATDFDLQINHRVS